MSQEKLARLFDEKRNVFSIAPGLPFLKILARALVDETLVQGFKPLENPHLLADATIFLPTRRAARGFSLELLEAMQAGTGSKALVLPDIRTIGDIDEEEVLLGLGRDIPVDIGKPIKPENRRLILARLAQAWSEALNPTSRSFYEKEDIVLPSSLADAIRLSGSIARFMDQVETEEIDWREISRIDVGDHAEWWQVTLTFLKIIMEEWPSHLKIQGEINPAEMRRRVIDFRIKQLAETASRGPVIAAGSTGSIPATTRLITAIANLKNGAVVLPGIDADLPHDIFEQIANGDELDVESALSTHPQFGLARLATKLKLRPSDILQIDHTRQPEREKIINIALLPPEKSKEWVALRSDFSDAAVEKAFNDISIIEAPGERQEALAIAIKMREALETPHKSAALVTPDRKLARRVASELQRFDIEIDDSGGASLSTSPPAIFLQQLLKCVFENEEPVTMSAFFKSDFLLLGRSRQDARRLGELLELLLIRNAIQYPDINDLEGSTRKAVADLADAKHAPYLLNSMSEETQLELVAFAKDIGSAISDLLALHGKASALDLGEILKFAITSIEKLSNGKDGFANIFEGASGETLRDILQRYIDIDTGSFRLGRHDIVPVTEVLLEEGTVRSIERSHPRLHIYGPLEARLQSIDLVILGSLNEGSWPQLGNNDPFLNRPMRAELALPLPERRIGLSAHDFQQLCGNREVVLSRAKRVDDAPSIASRWLQRLITFLGEKQAKALLSRGERVLQLAEEIDRHHGPIAELKPPFPTPPVHARPNSLSITEIETWIRDPYAIYAKHILGLQPLPPIIRDTNAALKGTLYHDIVARFVTEWKGNDAGSATVLLKEIADNNFESLALPDEIKAIWRPRFDKISVEFLDWEMGRRNEITESFCEVGAKAEIGDTGFTLRGRADRIDLRSDGQITVLDYKTGTGPSNEQARTLSPQLALEGALAMRGEFEKAPPGDLAELLYVRLRENEFKTDNISSARKKDDYKEPDIIAEDAWGNLKELIIAYQNPKRGYQSRYAPTFEKEMGGDYDHLARVREWSLGDDEDGEVYE